MHPLACPSCGPPTVTRLRSPLDTSASPKSSKPPGGSGWGGDPGPRLVHGAELQPHGSNKTTFIPPCVAVGNSSVIPPPSEDLLRHRTSAAGNTGFSAARVWWEGSVPGTFLVARDQSIPRAAGSAASRRGKSSENLLVLSPKPTVWVRSAGISLRGRGELPAAAGLGSYEWDGTGGICLCRFCVVG